MRKIGNAMDGNASNAFQRLLQLIAIFLVIVFWSMILHKGSVDILALAQKHSGDEFWVALAKYLLRNIGGG